jgi:hypothetical protein
MVVLKFFLLLEAVEDDCQLALFTMFLRPRRAPQKPGAVDTLKGRLDENVHTASVTPPASA